MQTLCHLAAGAFENMLCLEIVLGMSVKHLNSATQNGKTPLHYAALRGELLRIVHAVLRTA